jgi:hypothetical protein
MDGASLSKIAHSQPLCARLTQAWIDPWAPRRGEAPDLAAGGQDPMAGNDQRHRIPLLPTLRGNGFWTPETEGPQPPLRRSFFPTETASRPCAPQNRGVFVKRREISVRTGLRGGLGGLEPATRRLWSEGIPRRRGTRDWRRTAWWGPRGLEPATRRLSAPASKMVAERTGILLRTER